MEAKRVGVLGLLLVYGVFFLGMKAEYATAVKECSEICRAGAKYMKCKCQGDKELPAPCNCCNEEPDCTIYYEDGTELKCSSN
ncbi:hypothetical protein Vadar_000310 [Vaccinium darrowii]|uniref:Uncharacterized protein n=1 Tax=Vaccinium darrowii TaxID=229202 RepID=A0ACB7Z2M4_9ERIC|nr:hypothetical protein Vadar_000310 [Vaccinium darrowii]